MLEIAKTMSKSEAAARKENMQLRKEVERLKLKLRRVCDWLGFAANSDGGIRKEVQDALWLAERNVKEASGTEPE